MKKGVLIGSGSGLNCNKLNSIIKNVNLTIAIDGGMDHLLNNNIIPDLVLGDLDSISKSSLNKIKENQIKFLKYPAEKDYTDMELGIKYLSDNNYDEIIILGATGNRLDHTIANMYLLEKIDSLGIKGRIEDEDNTILLVKDYLKLEKNEGYYISVVPIYESGAVVTLNGFKYPLDKFHIKFGSTIGISNEIVNDFAEIHIDNGKVLVFISKD